MDLASILAATDNFSKANMLGEGGFGPVYRVGGFYYDCHYTTTSLLVPSFFADE
jgi:hypothetical protein